MPSLASCGCQRATGMGCSWSESGLMCGRDSAAKIRRRSRPSCSRVSHASGWSWAYQVVRSAKWVYRERLNGVG